MGALTYYAAYETVSLTRSFKSVSLKVSSNFWLNRDKRLLMVFILDTLWEIVRRASLRNSGLSIWVGRFWVTRESFEARFFRSCKKKADMD